MKNLESVKKAWEQYQEHLNREFLVKVVKIERYNEKIKQNRLSTTNQEKLFAELNGQTQESNEIPDAD